VHAKTVSDPSPRAHTQQLAQDQTEVERADMNQLPLQNVVPSAQVTASQTAGFVTVRESAFHQLAPSPQ